jgi:hypothetical protein
MSWNASELGDPILCLLLFSESKVLHSARFSLLYLAIPGRNCHRLSRQMLGL